MGQTTDRNSNTHGLEADGGNMSLFSVLAAERRLRGRLCGVRYRRKCVAFRRSEPQRLWSSHEHGQQRRNVQEQTEVLQDTKQFHGGYTTTKHEKEDAWVTETDRERETSETQEPVLHDRHIASHRRAQQHVTCSS